MLKFMQSAVLSRSEQVGLALFSTAGRWKNIEATFPFVSHAHLWKPKDISKTVKTKDRYE